jgi:REP element-mobilizing transposase RayT
MPQSISYVYTHITFSTKYRKKIIDYEIEEKLFQYLGGICKTLECNPIRIGGHLDHVHLLCTLGRKINQADLIEEIKKSSSKWMKKQGEKYSSFYWQNGYGIFSVNPAEVDVVTKYIANQKSRHSIKTFQDEFRAFLTKYKIDFDERYIWD